MSTQPLIEFKNASLGYGKRAVLTGVNFKVHPGDFVGVLGHNGSGKTTLLRTILGLIPALRGEFLVRGAKRSALRYGYVPQKERLDPIYPLSAYEVAAMGTYRRLELLQNFRGLDPKEHVARCLKDCGASELAHKRYSDLSGGQKQRTLIARALAAEPELLALDEPLAGIDATTHTALVKLFKELKENRNFTVLMVSHRIQVEKELFTHIAWVDEGEVDFGPAGDMLSKGRLAEVFKSEL